MSDALTIVLTLHVKVNDIDKLLRSAEHCYRPETQALVHVIPAAQEFLGSRAVNALIHMDGVESARQVPNNTAKVFPR